MEGSPPTRWADIPSGRSVLFIPFSFFLLVLQLSGHHRVAHFSSSLFPGLPDPGSSTISQVVKQRADFTPSSRHRTQKSTTCCYTTLTSLAPASWKERQSRLSHPHEQQCSRLRAGFRGHQIAGFVADEGRHDDLPRVSGDWSRFPLGRITSESSSTQKEEEKPSPQLIAHWPPAPSSLQSKRVLDATHSPQNRLRRTPTYLPTYTLVQRPPPGYSPGF